MRKASITSLWSAIKDLFGSIYQTLQDDQKRMDELKRKHEIAEMDLNGEWTDSRGTEGQSWHVEVDDDEDIIGI